MTADTTNRFAHIDAMRAVAVMFVVVAHAGLGAIVPGGSGVTIFFSISGFIITYLLLRERDASGGFAIGAFYYRRALKIGPPLLVCVIVPTLIFAIFQAINWPPFYGITFFYYNWYAARGIHEPLPGSGVTWSLSIEEQFYLAFAIIWIAIIKLSGRSFPLVVVAAIAIVYSTVSRIVLAGAPPDRIYFGSDTRLDGIAWGVLAAVALHQSLKGDGKTASIVRLCAKDVFLIAAVLLYIASLAIREEWFRDTFRFTLQALAACVLILYGFGRDRSKLRTAFDATSRIRLIQLIGLASYSIYLVHALVMYYSHHLVDGIPKAVSIPLLIVVGTASGMLLYMAVERPVQRMRKKRKALRQATEPDSAAAANSPTSPPETPDASSVHDRGDKVP